jgi:hypothetical protein
MTPVERSAVMTRKIEMPNARFAIGDLVRHRLFDFRGVIFDVDPQFANSEEWYEAIPEAIRPPRDADRSGRRDSGSGVTGPRPVTLFNAPGANARSARSQRPDRGR